MKPESNKETKWREYGWEVSHHWGHSHVVSRILRRFARKQCNRARRAIDKRLIAKELSA